MYHAIQSPFHTLWRLLVFTVYALAGDTGASIVLRVDVA